MKPGILWLGSLLLLPLAGMPLVWSRSLQRFSFPCRLALVAGVGAFLVSLEMTALALLNVRWNVATLTAGAFLLALVLAAVVNRGAVAGVPAPKGPGRAFGTLLSAASIFVVIVSVCSGAASSGDLMLFWGPKAEAFAAARTIDVAYLKDPFLMYLHPSYPPLVANIYAFATMSASRFAWGASTATFPLVLVGLAMGLHGILRRWLGFPYAAAVVAFVVSAIGLMGMEADVAGNGEMLLLFFETLAIALLLSPDADRADTQVLAGVLLGGAASSKVEGLPFVLATVAMFLFVRRDNIGRPWGPILRLMVPTVAALGFWFAFGFLHHVFQGYRGYGSVWKIYPQASGVIVSGVAHSLYRIAYGLPYLLPVSVWLALGARRSGPSLIPLGVAAALVTFFLFTYIHQPDPTLWIAWSAARILSPLIPLFVLATVVEADDRRERGARPSET